MLLVERQKESLSGLVSFLENILVCEGSMNKVEEVYN